MPRNTLKHDDNDYMSMFESIQQNLKLVLSLIIITNFVIIFFVKFTLNLKQKIRNMFHDKEKKKETLLIIAHPDDEVMFFCPTIRNIAEMKNKLRILCLSNGDYDGIGNLRQEEFKQICKNLKVEDYTILNDPKLQDNLHNHWEHEHVSHVIDDYMNSEENFDKVGTIITFDEYGVTKHPNHVSCHYGVIEFLKTNRQKIKDKCIETYLLESYNAISRYTFIIPFLTFYLRMTGFFNKSFIYSWRLMKIYVTQFNWYRRLHVLFGCYTYLNNFIKIELS